MSNVKRYSYNRCDEVSTMRLEDTLVDAGNYAMSMQIKSANTGSITFMIGEDTKAFMTGAGWERKEMITNVASVADHYIELQLVPGEYWIYHAKLEKGNKITDWSLAQDDVKSVIMSDTEPSDKSYLWCDNSVTPPLLKQWNGEEWIIVNDNAEAIAKIYTDITTAISDAEGRITLEVDKKVYTKEEVEKIISDESTNLSQTYNQFLMSFNSFKESVNSNNSTVNGKFEKTEKYIRFIDGRIELGVIGNKLMAVLKNDRLSFMESNFEVAYISNMSMYIRHAIVTEDLIVCNVLMKRLESGYFVFAKA